MTKPKSEKELGMQCWKVRIIMKGGAQIHVLSEEKPKIILDEDKNLLCAEIDHIVDTPHGDEIGYIDWSYVASVSWRKA